MPGQVQSRLQLPTRKVRSTPSKRVEDTPTETISAPSTPSRTRSKLIAPPMEVSDSLSLTPRRAKKAATSRTPAKLENERTPGKRKGAAQPEKDSGVSPSKRVMDTKENYVISSPSVHLSKLSLNSPCGRRPLAAKSEDNAPGSADKARRGNLFGQTKLNDNGIEDLLFCSESRQRQLLSPRKGPTQTFLSPRKVATQTLKVDDDISFKSPVKSRTPKPGPSPRQSLQSPIKSIFKRPLDLNQSPAKALKSPAKPRQSPVKAKQSPAKSRQSPLKGLTSDALEDLLCSPVKVKSPMPSRSPRRSIQALPVSNLFLKPAPLEITSTDQLEDLLCSPKKAKSPRKPMHPAKSPARSLIPVRSPRKAATPVKSPRKGAANLFSSPVKNGASPAKAATPSLPATPTLFKADLSQFQSARQALHTGPPGELLCRADQVNAMSSWIDEHLLKKSPGSLYVSGAPGTGKTATLTHLLNTKLTKQRTVFINCMVLKSSVAIYKEVAKQLNKKSTAKSEKEALKEIEKVVTAKGDMILLVLDEVDQLESKNQDVLYTVFEWPALAGSRLSLVGIANTLDLTDRVLPRLQIKDCYRPTLLHYPPYNKLQIIQIITKRLEMNGVPNDVIAPRAIAYLAGKISTLSGDIRKALDVCRRALEQAEGSVRKQALLKPLTPRGLNSPTKSPHKGYKVPKSLPKIGQVDLPQIMRVINQVYGSKLSTCMSAGSGGLPNQQKILLSSLLLMVLKGTSKEVTLGRLVQTYTKVCKKRDLTASEEAECVGMIQGLESRGMVNYVSKGAPRYAKITLRLDEKEVEMALEDKALLASILGDTSCIV